MPEVKVPVRSVKKACDLLDAVLFEAPRRGGLSLSELGARLGMPANSARNILKSMIFCGFISQQEDSKYIPGPKCLQIGRLDRLMSETILNRIQKHLTVLCDEVAEATIFAVLSGAERVVVARSMPNQLVSVNQNAIQTGKLYQCATGRLLTAYATPEERAEIVRRHGYPGELWDNLNDETEFNRALEAVRSAGFYAIRHKELAGWGFPVMKRNGILGAVGCYVPLFRCTPKKEEMVMQKLRETAKILESEMRNGRTTTTSGEE